MYPKMLLLRKNISNLRNHEIWRNFSSFASIPKITGERCYEQELKEGEEIEGFVVNKVAPIQEFNMTAIKLKHKLTGAQYLHLARDDQNNAFCVGFRTTPTDSTGLPHILEHTTLCGSEKYPCRDPFFKMLNRSMATFMNAMTGPDYTIYPFSTQNPTDYKNLMSVYLDAVFHPHLRESDFRQEGWRLEHTDVNDKTSPIILKGVVFNEMKGALSENQTLFFESLLNNILPSHTYGVISGGDPLVIPQLKYKDLKEFHNKYYHPSNARFYSYGNFPLVDHLKFINSQYLSDYKDSLDYSKSSEVPPEPRWDQERRKHVSCRSNNMAPNSMKQSSIAIASLCSDIKNVNQIFVLNILSELLVRGPNSAFYKSLIEPNIGGGFSPVTGYESHVRDTFFAVGLQGVSSSDFDKIVNIYHNTIDNVIEEGFEENNINAILHNIELAVKNQSSDFGLSILFQIAPLWNHNGDIIQTLKINQQVEKFKRAMSENSLYLQDRVQEFFKENNHRLILTMSPDPNYESKLAEKEETLLREKLTAVLPTERDIIYQKGQELANQQDQKDNLNCLPTLKISDLSSDVERTTLDGLLMQSVPIQICTAPTNDIIYFRGVLNVDVLSDSAKDLLPLFCYIMTKMGTKTHDYRQLDQMIQLRTGGLGFTTHLAQNIFDTSTFEVGLLYSSFCLLKNVKPMFSIWENLFNSVDLTNEKRFETLVHIHAANLINGICDSGHLYAMASSESLISPAASMKERFDGLTYIRNIKKLSLTSDLVEFLEMMQSISKTVLMKKFSRASLNISPGNKEKVFPATDNFLKKVKGKFEAPFILSKVPPLNKTKSIHHIMNLPVNYTAMSIPTVEYTHPDFPALRVLARLLSSKYFLPRIREKGGAYGAGAKLSTDGALSFFSYRDPKVLETFNTFDETKQWLSNEDFSSQDVEEAKLGVFQSIDAPIPPGSRGSRNFLYGISDEELQKQRESIMGLTKEDLIKVSSYLDSPVRGRALLGPSNPEILKRESENWHVQISDNL